MSVLADALASTTTVNSVLIPPSTPRKPLATIPCPGNTPFATPRRRKTPAMTKLRLNFDRSTPWPRIGCCIPEDILVDATKQIYGYVPHDWQLQAFYKVAEGHDVFALAGTGYGKSLLYGLLAIAAAIAQRGGTAVVISPLKALETDQVSVMIHQCAFFH